MQNLNSDDLRKQLQENNCAMNILAEDNEKIVELLKRRGLQAIDRTAEQQAGPAEWIPMSEKWPPLGKLVLVTCANSDELIGVSSLVKGINDDLYYWNGYGFNEITHWTDFLLIPTSVDYRYPLYASIATKQIVSVP